MSQSESAPRPRAISPTIYATAALALLAFVWWGRTADLNLLYAAYGLSPMTYVHKTARPADFALDFPSGIENVHKSAPMRLYTLGYTAFGLDPETLLPIFLAAELPLMAVAMVALTRTLCPDAPPGVAAIVVALVVASGARDMNFASFAQPFFWGKYYNIADAFRILAVVMLLRGRLVLCAVLLAATMMTHPTMGVMGVLFCAGCLIVAPKSVLNPRGLIAGVVFVALAGAWVLGVVGFGHTAGEPFPASEWFDLTRLMGAHWYPVENGLLTTNHHGAFLPFLSFLILVGLYAARTAPTSATTRKALAGMGAMLVLVVLGFGFSLVRLSPTMVKLALHRANDMVLTVGLVYVVAGLWGEVASGAPWRRVIAVLVLASTFFSTPGFPLALSLLLAAPVWLWPRAEDGRWRWLAGAPAAAAVLAMAFYLFTGHAASAMSDAYTGLHWLARPVVLIAVAVAAMLVLAVRRIHEALPSIMLTVAVACAAVPWVHQGRLNEHGRVWCRHYKDAQLWARDHTPRDSLFLVDPVIRYPSIGYGWRGYSQRSSFGTVREWLYSAWCYGSDYAVCKEGQRRLAEFGLRAADYFNTHPPIAGSKKLAADLHRRYYSASDAWRLDIARRYGIHYFVSRKLGTAATSALPVAYENKLFVIHAVPTSTSESPG